MNMSVQKQALKHGNSALRCNPLETWSSNTPSDHGLLPVEAEKLQDDGLACVQVGELGTLL